MIKTEFRFMRAALIVFMLLFGLTNAFSQGRHHRDHHGHDKRERDRDHLCSHHHCNHHKAGHSHDRYHHSHYRRSDGPPPWARAHRPHVRTRYVYFKDYNTYYDCNRNVYITFSGRNWAISAELPERMRRVEKRRIVFTDVDYYGDDVNHYHVHHHYHGRRW